MSHRPYPNITRARHQLDRTARVARPATLAGLEVLRSWSLTASSAGANARAAIALMPTSTDLVRGRNALVAASPSAAVFAEALRHLA